MTSDAPDGVGLDAAARDEGVHGGVQRLAVAAELQQVGALALARVVLAAAQPRHVLRPRHQVRVGYKLQAPNLSSSHLSKAT